MTAPHEHILGHEIIDGLRHPKECWEDPQIDGRDHCGKSAIALRIDPEERVPYPVCAKHARADMIPLERLVKELLDLHEGQRSATRSRIGRISDTHCNRCGNPLTTGHDRFGTHQCSVTQRPTALIAHLGKITGDSSLSPAQKSAQCRALYLAEIMPSMSHEVDKLMLELRGRVEDAKFNRRGHVEVTKDEVARITEAMPYTNAPEFADTAFGFPIKIVDQLSKPSVYARGNLEEDR